MTSVAVNNHLKNRKAAIDPTIPHAGMSSWNVDKLKNRRIVLAIRHMSEDPNRPGADRTISIILHTENAKSVIPAVQKYVLPGTRIQTDDGNAYSSLSAWYEHEVVRHSVEYSTDSGTNNNQAESFMGRMRRAEYGVYHGMRPQYLAFYAAEIAWREDVRHLSVMEKLNDLIRRISSCDISLAYRGYAQGHRLKHEYLG